jgi:hypothetical protein
MSKTTLEVPEVAMIAVTRGLAGAGIGLLVADKLRARTRTRLGWALLAIGAATTVPLLASVLRHRVSHTSSHGGARL